ncbi:hypothetical protein KCP73_15125 [Salmonella enterica subsp. enterica]|nr:hypothetical protein KCP73_15125 [Salmonella enterica subsp. enterica]
MVSRFLYYRPRPESLRAQKNQQQSSPSFATCQVIHLHICCNSLASRQAHPMRRSARYST